jgi:serine/threonine protein kinase
MSLAPNQQLSEYHIVRVLGQGAFGTVYLAHDTLLDRPVAIKELTVIAQTDEVAFRRFLQEARAAGGLNHPNIVTVHALKVVESNIYLVMEYLAGGSLRALLKERGPLPVEEAMRITADVCDGLAAAHAKGIIHRDVKPENILLTENGRAKVGDFGIAHVPRDAGGTSLTQFGFQPGTLIYMSPEQIRGQPVDGRSDVYQVGTLLYEMLTGRHYVDLGALEWRARETAGSNVMLFQARLYEMLAEAICERDPEGACRVRPDVPEWIGEALAAALTKALEERPTSEELARALRGKKAVWAVSTMPPQLVGIAPAEEGLSRDMAYAQQGLLDVGWAFISTQHLDVLGRPRSNPKVGWQALGATPGRIQIPPDYEFGIRAMSLNDDELAVLTRRLMDFGPIQLLDLSHSYITNAGLAQLRKLTGLQRLNLWDCMGITEVGLHHLEALKGLTSLGLSGCDITDWGLRHLKALPNLTDLDLAGCSEITDAGLTHLQALPKLANLRLSGIRITDKGIAELKPLTNLASLELVGTTVTDLGVAQLAHQLKGCVARRVQSDYWRGVRTLGDTHRPC